MTEGQQPDALKKLVIFMIALAILGTFVSALHVFTVDIPAQKALQAPSNAVDPYCPLGTPNCEVPATCQELWPGRCSGLPKPG